MANCDHCKNNKECTDCDRLTYRQLLVALLAATLAFGVLHLGVRNVQAKASCITREQVDKALDQKKCLVIYNGNIYDVTAAEGWSLTGHYGGATCGKEYDKEAIEAGPHPVSVMDKFLAARLCANDEQPIEVVSKTRGIFGMSWTRFSVYLSLVFFLLNFATCYAMPWARLPEPWKGKWPGKDKDDLLGRFPLTHMHKLFAWLAIFSLSLHGILGFAGVWFGIRY